MQFYYCYPKKESYKVKKKMFGSVCGSQDFHNPIALLVLEPEGLGNCSGELKTTSGLQTNSCLKPIARSSKLNHVC